MGNETLVAVVAPGHALLKEADQPGGLGALQLANTRQVVIAGRDGGVADARVVFGRHVWHTDSPEAATLILRTALGASGRGAFSADGGAGGSPLRHPRHGGTRIPRLLDQVVQTLGGELHEFVVDAEHLLERGIKLRRSNFLEKQSSARLFPFI